MLFKAVLPTEAGFNENGDVDIQPGPFVCNGRPRLVVPSMVLSDISGCEFEVI